jgi:hypothetical protein
MAFGLNDRVRNPTRLGFCGDPTRLGFPGTPVRLGFMRFAFPAIFQWLDLLKEADSYVHLEKREDILLAPFIFLRCLLPWRKAIHH